MSGSSLESGMVTFQSSCGKGMFQMFPAQRAACAKMVKCMQSCQCFCTPHNVRAATQNNALYAAPNGTPLQFSTKTAKQSPPPPGCNNTQSCAAYQRLQMQRNNVRRNTGQRIIIECPNPPAKPITVNRYVYGKPKHSAVTSNRHRKVKACTQYKVKCNNANAKRCCKFVVTMGVGNVCRSGGVFKVIKWCNGKGKQTCGRMHTNVNKGR